MYYDVENVIARGKIISLATLLSGGISRACADLTMSLGAAIRGEYRLAKLYHDILRNGDSVLRYVLNTYWIASKGIEMDF